jgi:cell wall-associated NlpC family hydrolase
MATGAPQTAAALTTDAEARRAAEAIKQSALDATLAAARQRHAAEAAETAAAAKAAQAKTAQAKATQAKAAQGKAAQAKAAQAKAAQAKAAQAKAARVKAAQAAAEVAREQAAAQAAARAAERARQDAPPASPPSAPPTSSSAPTPSAGTTVAPASSTVDRLIAFLKSQLGKPYVYGATGPGAYDCSGLTQAAFSSVGVHLPRTSQEQSTVGAPVSLSALQAGDLIFWGGQGSAHHVGVYIGRGQYLDAANPSTPVAIHQLADYTPDWAVRVL